jgi:hypothetical protein
MQLKHAETKRTILNARTLRLPETSIEHVRGDGAIDFHSFRTLRVTKCSLTGMSSCGVRSAARLLSESLLGRYAKISQEDFVACVDAVPLPKIHS